jgi:hypothetical protein
MTVASLNCLLVSACDTSPFQHMEGRRQIDRRLLRFFTLSDCVHRDWV